MTKLLRALAFVFASAIVRRVAYMLVALALVWCGIGRAQAQDAQLYPTREAAYSACVANKSALLAQYPAVYHHPAFANCGKNPGTNEYQCFYYMSSTNAPLGCGGTGKPTRYQWTTECPAGLLWDETSHQCREDCNAAKDYGPQNGYGGDPVPHGTLECHFDGCEVAFNFLGGNLYSLERTGAQCEREDYGENCPTGYYRDPNIGALCYPREPTECPAGTVPVEGVCTKPNSCPSGMIEDEKGQCKPKANECPAGEVKGPDGSCVKQDCPAGQVRGEDGTCKKDGDGDGEEDPSEENSFSGGDDCSTPPQCSGDPILCGQARIQWRIECNTRRNTNVSGGACDSPPICAGEKCDPLEYAQLLQQWRTACAVQRLADRAQGGNGGIVVGGGNGGNGDEPPGWMDEVEPGDPGQGAQPVDEPRVHDGGVIDGSMLDFSGLGGGGGALSLCSNAGGSTPLATSFASKLCTPPQFFVDFIGWIKVINIVFGTIVGIYILSGRGAS